MLLILPLPLPLPPLLLQNGGFAGVYSGGGSSGDGWEEQGSVRRDSQVWFSSEWYLCPALCESPMKADLPCMLAVTVVLRVMRAGRGGRERRVMLAKKTLSLQGCLSIAVSSVVKFC